MSKPWVARLFPERNSSLYVRAQVWPTKQAFLAHMNEFYYTVHGNRFGPRTDAACANYESYRYSDTGRRRSPCIAVVNFWRGALGTGVITHELFHATLRWAGRVGFDLSRIQQKDVTMYEERITYVHGNICRAFVDQGTRRGIYARPEQRSA